MPDTNPYTCSQGAGDCSVAPCGIPQVNHRYMIPMRATDPEYALAMKNADTAKVWQLENLFELQAEEIAIQTCLVM